MTAAEIDREPVLRELVNHISDRYVEWRPELDGEELPYAERTELLRSDSDRDRRRKAWKAVWELGDELEEQTREMFARRNEAAQQLGYENYAHLKLRADGVSRQWLERQFGELENATEETFSGYLAEQADRYGIDDVQPWDIQFLFDRDPWPPTEYFPPDKLRENLFACAEELGVTEDLGIEVIWYDSPYGGQCVTYEPGDIRILTNKGGSMLHYHTAYHEYGHALHSVFNEQPWTLRRESGMFTEGMAQLMALFLHYPSWLKKTGLADDEIERYRETRKLPWMYRHRRIAADVMSELSVWDDPEVDFNRVYGEQTARYLGCGFQPRPFAAVPRWTRPVRMHSYFIADLISAQTHAYLRANFRPLFGSNEALAHVREHYWKPGNSIPWLQKVKNCTGEELTYDYLGREMTGLLPEA
jgi:hypothetical protein